MGARWGGPGRQARWDDAVIRAHEATSRPRWWWVLPGLVAVVVTASLVGLLARAGGAL